MFTKFFYDIKHFGFSIAHYNLWGELADFNLLPFRLKMHIKHKRFDLTYKFLVTKYSDFIKNYKYKKINYGEGKKIIWCCWWQGEENAPEIVKICLKSIRKHNCGYEVIVISKNNYKKYVTIPKNILEKVNSGKITLIHFSDILRMALLKEYGGVWVDATMYITDDIFNNFSDINVNSNVVSNDESGNKWCGFFIGGKPNKLFDFVYEFIIKYNNDYDKLINYFLIDYAINIAYNNFEECKNDIDNITLHNNEIFSLSCSFNKEYNNKEYEKIIKNGFFKLSYKEKYSKLINNDKLTIFGEFIKENGDTL
jgi:mannosyltransferase OCH1-like enzyme